MLCTAVQRHINAVLIPEGIAEPHRHIVSSSRVHGKAVGHRAVIAQSCDTVFNGDDAGRAGVAIGVPVDIDRPELGFLLLSIGGQVAPAVVRPRKLGVFAGNSVRPFHVVVDMGESIRHLVVVVPIGHDGDKGLGRGVTREVVRARHPELRGIVGVGDAPVGFTQVLRRVVDLPVPAVGRHPQEDLVRVHDLGGVIVDALQPASRRNRPRRAPSPGHAVAHNRRRVTVSVEVSVDTPVLAAHRAIDAGHPRQADVHVLCGIVILYRIVDVSEHCCGFRMGGIAVPAFQIDVDAVAPGVLLHDADDLRKEHILRPVCVVP